MYRYGKRCCFREAMVEVVRYQSEKIHLCWGVDDWRIISILICSFASHFEVFVC